MGLYILPGRLKKQTEEIARILCRERPFDIKNVDESDPLFVHKEMIEILLKENKYFGITVSSIVKSLCAVRTNTVVIAHVIAA